MTLAQAIRFARRHNLQISSARLGVRSAREGRKLGWALLGPHVSFGVDFSFLGGDSSFDGANMGGGTSQMDPAQVAELCNQASDSVACLQWMMDNGEYAGLLLGSAMSGFGAIGDIFNADTVKFSLGAAWPLLNWQALLNVRRTKVAYRLSRAALQNTEVDVVANVTLAFFGVLAAQDALQILEKAAKNTREHLRQSRALKEAGRATEVDVLRWRAKVADDRQNLLEAAQRIQSARIGLNNLLGRRLSAAVHLARPAALDASALPAPARVREPRRSHPQLRLSRLGVRMKGIDVRGSQAAFLPSLTLSGGYNWQRFLPYEDVAKGTRWLGSWAVMLSLKVPLFDSMTKVYDVRLKKLALARAKLDHRNLVRFLRQQVRTADLQVRSAYTRIAAAVEQVRLAEAAHRSAENLYKSGAAKTTDVLDAQNGLRMARFNLLNARYSYLMARVRRDRVAGRIELAR